jgi:hypothetical protein
MTRLNVKGLKIAPAPTVQLGHTSVKFPKSMMDGTPLVLLAFGMNVSVAARPEDWFRNRLVPPNPVPDAFVVYMMVALALAAVINTITPVSEAVWMSCLIVMLCLSSPRVICETRPIWSGRVDRARGAPKRFAVRVWSFCTAAA